MSSSRSCWSCVPSKCRVGRETVTYVSNICKYYLAYQLIEDERAERQKTKEAIKQGN